MLTMEEKLRKLVEKAEKDAEVLAVIAFGSQVRGEAGPASDLDICLVLQPCSPEKHSLSQKRLDYLKEFDLDIQIYQQLPLYIRRRVLKEGRVLFCRDEKRLYELAFRTAQEFEDFKHLYYGYLAEVARG